MQDPELKAAQQLLDRNMELVNRQSSLSDNTLRGVLITMIQAQQTTMLRLDQLINDLSRGGHGD
jgi:hypothetical protein